ncbi:MAG: SRPBCC family protein [Burkholderiaceae bacterium]
MNQAHTVGTVAFERSHDIVVDAPAAVVFDYVTNPRSWPEWIAVSHHVESEDRPLGRGETFTEQWFSREEIRLDWTVLEADWPRLWVAETRADFLGPIVIRYDFESLPGGASRFTRTVGNPARPKAPSAQVVERIDVEAATALANIKSRVETAYGARAAARLEAIDAAMSDIRALAGPGEPDRAALSKIRERLIALASRADLFPRGDLPPPFPGSGGRSILYRLAEDDDHGFALYANASLGGYGTPAHNHTTWAVIAGVHGSELNRFYDRSDDGGVTQRGELEVVAGRGVAFMPDDLHSIHIDAPLLNFHLYGIGLEQLHRREYFDPDSRQWAVFPAHSDIRDARSGRA